VRIEVDPEPTPAEERALREALACVLADAAPEESAWWRRGVVESVTEALDEPPDAIP
jgi:hypothetical protein